MERVRCTACNRIQFASVEGQCDRCGGATVPDTPTSIGPQASAGVRANGHELVYRHENALFAIAMAIACLFWLLLGLSTVGLGLLIVAFIAVFGLLARSYFISHLRGNSIEVHETQLPELHAQLVEACRKLGIEKVPNTYVMQSEGWLNALAVRFLGRDYVVLFSTIVEDLADTPQAIDFYIGHELGHVHRRHLVWAPFLAPALFLPLLGSAYSRAREYTCDRYGLACVNDPRAAVAGLLALAAGSRNWKNVDVTEFCAQVGHTGGFFMSYNELTNGYPWLCKRASRVIELANGRDPMIPRRNPFAWAIAALVPSVPGGSSVLVAIAIVGMLSAIAVPAFTNYVKRAEEAEAANQDPDDEDVRAADTSGHAGNAYADSREQRSNTLRATIAAQWHEPIDPDNMGLLKTNCGQLPVTDGRGMERGMKCSNAVETCHRLYRSCRGEALCSHRRSRCISTVWSDPDCCQ